MTETVQLLVKTSGRGHKQARVHLFNPYPRKIWYYGEKIGRFSVCYGTISPKQNGWQVCEGSRLLDGRLWEQMPE